MQEFRRSATACGDMVNITFKIGAADWRHPLKVAFRSSESSWVMQTAANRYWRQGDSVVVVCYPFHMTVWLWWGWVGVFIRKRTVVGRRLQLAADADVRCGDQLTWLYGYNCSVVTVPGLVTTNALIDNCHTSLCWMSISSTIKRSVFAIRKLRMFLSNGHKKKLNAFRFCLAQSC